MDFVLSVEFEDMLLISFVLTIVAYVTRDLVIFRKTGDTSSQTNRNIIATVSDGILAFLVIRIMGDQLVPNSNDIVIVSLISTLIIAVGKWFFHKYLDT